MNVFASALPNIFQDWTETISCNKSLLRKAKVTSLKVVIYNCEANRGGIISVIFQTVFRRVYKNKKRSGIFFFTDGTCYKHKNSDTLSILPI